VISGKRFQSRRVLACLPLLFAAAVQAQSADIARTEISRAQLERESWQLQVRAERIAPAPGTAVYLSADASDRRLVSLRFRLDGEVLFDRSFSAAEGRALRGAALRLPPVSLGPGRHAYRIEYASVPLDSAATAKPEAEYLEDRLDIAESSALELRYERGLLRRPLMELAAVASDRRLRERYVRYLESLGDRHGAGLERSAPGVDAAAPAGRDEDRLQQARVAFRRGAYAPASDLLQPLLTPRPVSAEQIEAVDLYIRSLMWQQRFHEVATWYKGHDEPLIPSTYVQMNLATALARIRREEPALHILLDIGQAPAADAEGRALRDQANMALGRQLLHREQGFAASSAFRRIHLDSPLENRALLAMGWVALAPGGMRQHSGNTEKRDPAARDIGSLVDRLPLPAAPLTKNLSDPEITGLRKAMARWQELQRRDADDTAVWECWIVMPYVLYHAGAREPSIEMYRSALKRFEERERKLMAEGERLESMAQEIIGSAAPRALASGDLAILPESMDQLPVWVRDWLASHQAQLALANFADSRQHLERLRDASARVAGTAAGGESPESAELLARTESLLQSWNAVHDADRRDVSAAMRQQMKVRRQRLREYSRAAHLGLARALDPSLFKPRPSPIPLNFWYRLKTEMGGVK
jgi:hypothetical protein